jgi:rhamnogalacturonan endolyase
MNRPPTTLDLILVSEQFYKLNGLPAAMKSSRSIFPFWPDWNLFSPRCRAVAAGRISDFGFRIYVFAYILLCPLCSLASFGVISSGGYYTVDTGASFVFKVSQTSGDITSLVYNGTQYQATDKNTHIASGLGSATVMATTYGSSYIKLTITTSASNSVVSSLTHYLMVRNGFNHIYMATYVTAEPAVGELRWITRLQFNLVPNGPPESNNNGSTGAIESSDVFGHSDGTTTSKYYGRQRALELTYSGAYGNGIGVWSVFDNPRESSSGGPFYRDIENQGDGAGSDQEVYNYMNSGHEQTEAWRTNVLYGPYAMVFTSGSPPVLPLDYSWIETGGLNLTGWISQTNRGAIHGVASGIPAGFQGVVGFANANAQYWAMVSSNGTFSTPLMKPGAYMAILYKGELEVATNSVVVSAGQTNILNLASTESAPRYLFKLGEWDGTPAGFLNAADIINRHPSDVRNQPWGPVMFNADTDAASSFPAIQFRGTNSPATIKFNLTSSQLVAYTFRIGFTCAYNGGRPDITMNAWNSANFSPSSQPNSRSFTVGTYRGNNALFSFSIPAGAFVLGENTLVINPISGSSDLGPWLSAGWVYDALELDIPNTGPAVPLAVSSLNAAAINGSRIDLSWTPRSTNEINFLIERSSDNLAFNLIAATTAGRTNYSDTGLAPGSRFYYRIRASNSAGASAYSNTASAETTLPRFDRVSQSGAALTLNVSGGPAAGAAYLLMSTNADAPLLNWHRLATNFFDPNGSFTFTVPINLGGSASYYRLQLP